MLFFGTATEDLFKASRKLRESTNDLTEQRDTLRKTIVDLYTANDIDVVTFIKLRDVATGFVRPQVFMEGIHLSMEARAIEHKQTSKLKRIIAILKER